MLKWKIIRQCQGPGHLFEFFVANNKVIFGDFTIENLKIVYLVVTFSDYTFQQENTLRSWKRPNKILCSELPS